MALVVDSMPGKSNFREESVPSRRMSSKSNMHRNLEKSFKRPEFEHVYPNHSLHPFTSQYLDEAHKFLTSHGVNKQLGPKLWSDVMSAKTPELAGFTYVGTEAKDFLWLCKFVAFLFAMDTNMDETESSDNLDKSCDTVLGMTLTLLWYNPHDELLLQHVNPLYENITCQSRDFVEAFNNDLGHARKKAKNLLDVKMTPIASAFRDLWIEYYECMPAEFVLRQAYALQDYFMGSVWEVKNRQTKSEIRHVRDYVAIRRMTAASRPCIICTDMIISRSLKVPQISNSFFFGPEMQSLLLAITDIIAWHNDLFSFQQEVIVAEDTHNLVKVVYEEQNCASYSEAGGIVLQLLHERIADLERDYEQLKEVASPEYHPAIDRYMVTCREWISGTHQWHLTSTRYVVAGTVM